MGKIFVLQWQWTLNKFLVQSSTIMLSEIFSKHIGTRNIWNINSKCLTRNSNLSLIIPITKSLTRCNMRFALNCTCTFHQQIAYTVSQHHVLVGVNFKHSLECPISDMSTDTLALLHVCVDLV